MEAPGWENVILAMLGGVALKWMFERLLNVAAPLVQPQTNPPCGEGKCKGLTSQEYNMLKNQEREAEMAYQRHVIEVLAKMSILLEQICRRLDDRS